MLLKLNNFLLLALMSAYVTSSLADDTNAGLKLGYDRLMLKGENKNNHAGPLGLKGSAIDVGKKNGGVATPSLSLKAFEAVRLREARSLRGPKGHRSLAPNCERISTGDYVCVDDLGNGQCSITINGSQCDCCNYDSYGSLTGFDCSNLFYGLEEGSCTKASNNNSNNANCFKHEESGSTVCVEDLGNGKCALEIDGTSCKCCNYDTRTGDLTAIDCTNISGWGKDGICKGSGGTGMNFPF